MKKKEDPFKGVESLKELLETPPTTEETETWIEPIEQETQQAQSQKDALKQGDPNWPEAGE